MGKSFEGLSFSEFTITKSAWDVNVKSFLNFPFPQTYTHLHCCWTFSSSSIWWCCVYSSLFVYYLIKFPCHCHDKLRLSFRTSSKHIRTTSSVCVFFPFPFYHHHKKKRKMASFGKGREKKRKSMSDFDFGCCYFFSSVLQEEITHTKHLLMMSVQIREM